METQDQSAEPNSVSYKNILTAGRDIFVLFIVVALYFYISPATGNQVNTPVSEYLYIVHQFLWWEGYLIILIIAATSVAAYTESMVRTIGLCFACGAGVGIHLGGVGIGSGPPDLLFRLAWTLLLGGVTALAIGGLSFLLGSSLRKLKN